MRGTVRTLARQVARSLDRLLPQCQGWLAFDGWQYDQDRDRCQRCGGCHAITIEEEVVTAGEVMA